MQPIIPDFFYHDGRGPELQLSHYRGNGSMIVAADYFNPDDVYQPTQLKHILFIRPQVFMFTPEEVYGYGTDEWDRTRTGRAAAITFGQSKWLRSFSQRHLRDCEHFRLMFYDEYLDIICEGVEAKEGGYGKA